MAILNLDLLNNNNFVINADNADETNVVNISGLGNSTLTVDGVEATINSVAGVSAGANATFAAENGGTLNVDQGLLAVNALSSTTYKVGDNSNVNVDASGINLGALDSLLNANHSVEFSGENHTGTFFYDPPTISVGSGLAPITFNTTGMEATDQFIVDGKTLSLDTTFLGGAASAYRNGVLHLETGGLGVLTANVHVEVPMSQDQFDLFLANQGDYLSGGTFTFPGEIVCFARGTHLLTNRGEVAIEDLREGDMVITRDNGEQPIRWIGSTRVGAPNISIPDSLRPIRISAGSLGKNSPKQDLIVSPQHRVLVRSRIAQRMFGTTEVLVAAKQLLQVDGIDIATDLTEVEYFHMLFEQHEVVISNGAETESLYTGPEALKSVGRQAVQEIFILFPELRQRDYISEPARPLLSGRQGRKLAVRHVQNGQDLVM